MVPRCNPTGYWQCEIGSNFHWATWRWEVAATELRTFISQCVDAGLPVIPILLPGVDHIPENLPFLKELHWVKFGKSITEVASLDQLEWGITGKKPRRANS